MLKPITEVMAKTADTDEWLANPVVRRPPPDSHEHPLRRHSLEDFQKAIAGGLVDLTGPDFRARIVKLDFEPKSEGQIAGLRDAVELVVRILPIAEDDPEEVPF